MGEGERVERMGGLCSSLKRGPTVSGSISIPREDSTALHSSSFSPFMKKQQGEGWEMMWQERAGRASRIAESLSSTVTITPLTMWTLSYSFIQERILSTTDSGIGEEEQEERAAIISSPFIPQSKAVLMPERVMVHWLRLSAFTGSAMRKILG